MRPASVAAVRLFATHALEGGVNRGRARIELDHGLLRGLATGLRRLVDGTQLIEATGLHAHGGSDLLARLSRLTCGNLAASVGRFARRGAAVQALALPGTLALDRFQLVGLAHALTEGLDPLAVVLDDGCLFIEP